ncbi:hypothetical protein BDZ97DRAFT_1760929 [Flammula alnicola]|nr:hypothetical protein BDZ97DRAFT_1760929 [Flammula alnicola]
MARWAFYLSPSASHSEHTAGAATHEQDSPRATTGYKRRSRCHALASIPPAPSPSPRLDPTRVPAPSRIACHCWPFVVISCRLWSLQQWQASALQLRCYSRSGDIVVRGEGASGDAAVALSTRRWRTVGVELLLHLAHWGVSLRQLASLTCMPPSSPSSLPGRLASIIVPSYVPAHIPHWREGLALVKRWNVEGGMVVESGIAPRRAVVGRGAHWSKTFPDVGTITNRYLLGDSKLLEKSLLGIIYK